jgi:hypothetical protein
MMDISAETDMDDLAVRPSGGERRRYNRRRPDSEPPPPYFSVFERMADALEEIVGLLAVVASTNAPREQTEAGAHAAEPQSYPRQRGSAR